MNGFIYIISNESWDLYDAVKVGKTTNIYSREQCYLTYNIKRSVFVKIYEVPYKLLDSIDKIIKYEFKHINVYYEGGTEFFTKEIINLIEPLFNKLFIPYRPVTKIDELVNLNQPHVEQSYVKRDYQINIIEKAFIYYNLYDKGLLVLTCGLGKTLISLWIAEKLNSNSILVGVPNLLLLNQWATVINSVLPNHNLLLVDGKTDEKYICDFIKHNKIIIVTTYSSSKKLLDNVENKIFDIKIYDEVHHLTNNNIEVAIRANINILDIKSIKQLALTATLKEIEGNNTISNTNIDYFGKVIDTKNVLWAIQNNIICDYVIQTIVTNEEQLNNYLIQFNIVTNTDKRLFLSAYIALQSICTNTHHLLVYTNNTSNASKLINFIKLLIAYNYFSIENLVYSNYDSTMSNEHQINTLTTFTQSKLGILTCVYTLGEGFDLPLLDGVLFAESMGSKIRIVQSALRACRKDSNYPNKLAKIILPILNVNNLLDDSNTFETVREVIYFMSLEDETILQKIKVSKIDITTYTGSVIHTNQINKLTEYEEEMYDLIKLKIKARISLDITYEKAKQIIVSKNIKSKDEYYEYCKKDARLPFEPDKEFIEFINWVDYLGINKYCYSIQECKNKIKEYLQMYPELNKISNEFKKYELCKIDSSFPPYDLWDEYYNDFNLTDILTNKKKLQPKKLC